MRLACLLLAAMQWGGCAEQVHGGPDVVFVVPGVGGGGAEYNGIVQAVARPGRAVYTIDWGAPTPLFFLNFSDPDIHDAAEEKVARTIADWRRQHPSGRIDLIGHSAGAGVVLGALPRIGQAHVHTVILLAPSVSPSYDLTAALAHVDGVMHAFHSDRDTGFLEWRTSNFGTYDGMKNPAAGFAGFTGSYAPAKLVQHPYDPNWESLDYDGGHFSIRSAAFARQIIAPLLRPSPAGRHMPASSPRATTGSSAHVPARARYE
jgi:pimeloyl-ACP methyl ester carboxylesterase